MRSLLLGAILFAALVPRVFAASHRSPVFTQAVIVHIERLKNKDLVGHSPAADYVDKALKDSEALEEAGAMLDSSGPRGKNAKKILFSIFYTRNTVPHGRAVAGGLKSTVLPKIKSFDDIPKDGSWNSFFDGNGNRRALAAGASKTNSLVPGDFSPAAWTDPSTLDSRKDSFQGRDTDPNETFIAVPDPGSREAGRTGPTTPSPFTPLYESTLDTLISGPWMAPWKALGVAESMTLAVTASSGGNNTAVIHKDDPKPNLIVAATAAGPALAGSEEKSRLLKIIAVPIDTVKKVAGKGKKAAGKAARKELYKERKADLNKAFGITPGMAIGGAGVFKVRILSPEEVKADPVKQRVREEGLARKEEIVFLRTRTVAQLFGTYSIPIDVPIAGALPSLGLRLNGIIEIVQTRAIPREKEKALRHAKRRVFFWPLKIKKLKEDLAVGEDFTITARLDKGAAVGLGLGKELGSFLYATVGARARASVGRASDEWVSLSLKKTSTDTVRVLVQRGNGKVLSAMVQLYAGLDIYDDQWIPSVAPTSLEDSFIGGVLTEKGGKLIVKKLEKLLSAELSVAFTRSKHGVSTEGWGNVSLSDPESAKALKDLFHFKPASLRALPVDSTYSADLGTGRIRSRIRDVTNEAKFIAHLSALSIEKSRGTKYYEVQWQIGDGEPEHFLVGIADSKFTGKLTKTRRNTEAVMWHDLKRGKTHATVKLGPQKRLMTTTREVINDVLATLKALKVRVKAEIDHPSPYLQLFGLGNYGRTEENGWFSLSPEGVKNIGAAGEDRLVTSYLQADWLYEKESFPPGYIWADASQAPPWAKTADPEELRPILDFMKKNAHEARFPNNDPEDDTMDDLEDEYEALAPGRSFRSDAYRYIEAKAYAKHITDMQGSDDPEKMIELFLKFRRDRNISLKRAVVASAKLAGPQNYDGTIEMKGKRVTLIPLDKPADTMPPHPITEFNGIISRWKR